MTLEQGKQLAEAQTMPQKQAQPQGKKSPFKEDGFQHYYLKPFVELVKKRTKEAYTVALPIATVAIGPSTEEGKIVRGISICSDKDQWDRREGRKLAVSRCRRALGLKKTTQLVKDGHDPAPKYLYIHYGSDYGDYDGAIYKSAYNVEPTEKEARILANMVRKVNERNS